MKKKKKIRIEAELVVITPKANGRDCYLLWFLKSQCVNFYCWFVFDGLKWFDVVMDGMPLHV